MNYDPIPLQLSTYQTYFAESACSCTLKQTVDFSPAADLIIVHGNDHLPLETVSLERVNTRVVVVVVVVVAQPDCLLTLVRMPQA